MRILAALVLLLAAAGASPAQEGPALPRDLAGWMRRQDQMLQGGAGEKALAEAAARVEREPKSPEALFLHGRILGNTGDVDGARAKFQAALDADPNYPEAWRGMALVHLKAKEYDTAAREARRAYDLEGSHDNLVLLVKALYEAGDRPGAYGILKEALARAPADHDLRAFFASLLFQERNIREAEREARQVLASAPDHATARQILVAILVNTGRREDAVAECREVVRRRPGDASARFPLFEILIAQKDYAGAAAVLEDVLKLDLPPEFRATVEADLRKLRSVPRRPIDGEDGALAADLDEKKVLADLDSPVVATRRAAMDLISSYRLNYLPGALLRRAGDEDEMVRLAAVRLIGRHGEPYHLGILDVILFRSKQRDPSTAVRARAVGSAARIGSPAGLVLLFRGLEETEPEVFGAVIRGFRDLTGKCLVDDPDAPLAAEAIPAVRARAAAWWFEDPTARQWRLKAAGAIAEGDLRDLAWYLVPWLQEEDAGIRAAALDAVARLSRDAGWRSVPTGTKGEREAARDRAYAFLAERDRAAAEPPERK